MSADPELIERLGRLDTCAVSDVLDGLGLPSAAPGIHAVSGTGRPVAGRAVTVQVIPKRGDLPGKHIATEALADARDGDVLVIDNGGRTDVSCWGGLLSLAATARGVRGVVVDGACRDVAEATELGFTVFARAVVPTTARGRIVQANHGEPITVGAVAVATGDLVLADTNGVVFVPADRAAEAIAGAEALSERERQMAEAIRSGTPVAEVMHDSRFKETPR
ncbi:RraA family protein [Phytohabitans kaempferiae]|uniref:Putative 4-hydroxy-4-methyl-2-oxoglutarate aldolase n=1 Tax=Phytohabitans kaempferiae TaxID=1620943 RepID=A0ABV6M4T4_9ACTN